MKKTIFLVCLAVLALGAIQAKPTLGVRAGLNVARLQLTASEDGQNVGIDTASSIGVHVGGFVQFLYPNKLMLQPELLFTQKGTETGSSDEVTINYIAVPVLCKYDITLSTIHLQPLVAPEIGYAISAKSTYNEDFIDSINRVNLGLNLGGDLVYKENYFMGLRYYMGLNDLEKGAGKRPPISNTCWSVSMGYLF